MNTTESKDWLDETLATPLSVVKDNGFSASVMAKLPHRRRNIILLETMVRVGLPLWAAGGLLVYFWWHFIPVNASDLWLQWLRSLNACALAMLGTIIFLFASGVKEALSET